MKSPFENSLFRAIEGNLREYKEKHFPVLNDAMCYNVGIGLILLSSFLLAQYNLRISRNDSTLSKRLSHGRCIDVGTTLCAYWEVV